MQSKNWAYAAYIKSDVWRHTRARIIMKRGKVCELCGCKKGIHHVHHLTYARLGNESEEDLQVLCESCHNQLHGGSPRGLGKRRRGKGRMTESQRSKSRKSRYSKLYKPWIPEDAKKMKRMGLPIPPQYQ